MLRNINIDSVEIAHEPAGPCVAVHAQKARTSACAESVRMFHRVTNNLSYTAEPARHDRRLRLRRLLPSFPVP